jgi:hypothetical protein
MRRLLALVSVGLALSANAADVRVATGGVGFEERETLERDRGYNLKVIVAMQGGQYLADVDVTILDAGGTPVVTARTNGPWLLAELPPGRYRLVADFRGASRTHDFSVARAQRQEIVLRWRVDEPTVAGPIGPSEAIR